MGWDSPPYEGRRWRYGWDYEPPKKTLSEVLDTIDGQYKDAQKLRNQITQSIMEKHLKSKAYPGLIQETTPLKEYLALVNAYLNDLIRKKGDTDNMVFKFMRERHDSIAKLEQRIQELEDEKAGLEPEEDHMMKSDIQLQTGVGTTCRNEGFKDVATVIEKHRDIAERLRQLKTVICNHSCSFSDEEDKIAKEIQRSIPLNAKRLGELQRKRPAENKIVRHGQAKRPCGNNQMSIQNHDNQAEEHLVMNGQYLVQLVKDSIKEHVQQNKGRVTEVPCESMTVNASDASVEKLIEATNDTATIASSEICFSNVAIAVNYLTYDFPSVTSDARELLRLINNDPSLASCIQCLTYDDPDDSELPLTDEYSQEQLTHDHKIFSQFSAELAEKSASKKTFGSSRKTSKLREMSVIYNKACIPILISRLPNLRKLVFAGRLGGKHSFLLTPAAKHIWQWMPPKSLQVLDWRPETYAPYLALLDKYEDKAYENQPTQHTDPWDAVSFLQLTPKMQHLTIVDDTFFTKTSRKHASSGEFDGLGMVWLSIHPSRNRHLTVFY
ncbi:hypothetical protein BZA77DRAFT_352159 [Pyronema omphalodes]|nr:hypothetical protein BZA77DRAFT_359349 [Pyronema omphalodes]KAI5817971.1 hypothetical protein BZA77DRAFT_352159 [Pyronema omphalodes]